MERAINEKNNKWIQDICIQQKSTYDTNVKRKLNIQIFVRNKMSNMVLMLNCNGRLNIQTFAYNKGLRLNIQTFAYNKGLNMIHNDKP